MHIIQYFKLHESKTLRLFSELETIVRLTVLKHCCAMPLALPCHDDVIIHYLVDLVDHNIGYKTIKAGWYCYA